MAEFRYIIQIYDMDAKCRGITSYFSAQSRGGYADHWRVGAGQSKGGRDLRSYLVLLSAEQREPHG